MDGNANTYLDMQRRQYERRAGMAVVGKGGIFNETVVGSWDSQEQFPYDDNILRGFVGPWDSCLEYGCGPGRNLLRLSKRFAHVSGVDISGKNCDNARKFLTLNNVKDFEIILTSGDNIPTEKKYNLVFSVICLQHICMHSVRQQIIRDMVRVCEIGGRVVIQMGFNDVLMPKSNHNTRYYADYYDEQSDVEDTNGYADCCVTKEEQLTGELKQLGLDPVGVWYTPGVNDINHDKWIWVSGVKP